ncbi:UNVERIFIED_ORG: lysophospholipase L1-like esterase [Arthrobacter sp. UYEF1]
MAKEWVKIANLKGPKGNEGTWYQRNLLAADDINTWYGYAYVGQWACPANAQVPIGAPVGATAGSFISEPVGSGASIQTWTNYKTGSTAPQRMWRRTASTVTANTTWFEVPIDITLSINPSLPVNADFDLYTTYGVYHIAANPTLPIADIHWPIATRGVLYVSKIGSSTQQMYWTYEDSARVFTRKSSGAVFGPWKEPFAPIAPVVPAAKPASGLKRVGVPITAGHSGSDAPLEATVRMPLLYQAPILRWRLRIQDINPRSAVTRAGAISLSGIWLGTHTGAGAMTGKVQLSGALSIPDGATEYKTPWFNMPLNAGTEYLLSFGYTKATAPWAMLGYSYQTADDANAGDDNPAGMTKLGTAPFSIAIEAETHTHTPVIASLGDSNSVGVGAVNGLHDSWLSQLCRRLKALPDHRGSSGDTCIGSLAGATYKYNRFADLSKPDTALMALGQNDAAVTDTTSAVVIPNINTVLGNLTTNVSENLYAVNYMPRTANPWAGFEAVRRELNTHLLTQPAGVRDVFDIAAAISSDDETITPAYDADGTHLNAAGFGQVQAAVNRPVTTPPVQYVAL